MGLMQTIGNTDVEHVIRKAAQAAGIVRIAQWMETEVIALLERAE